MKVTVRKTETVSVKAEENVKEPLSQRASRCQLPFDKGRSTGNYPKMKFNAWEGELAEAIVKMAIHDYIDALQTLAVNPKDEKALLMLDDCRDFFRGEWCAQLSPIDGELIIELVDGVMR